MPHFKISKTVRYETWGHPETAQELWFVLHGYGQLVPFFIRKFQVLDPEKYLIIAPEGLHRFYQKGFYGRVGASWMTKEDRLTDIADYIAYLDLLYGHIIKEYGGNYSKKRILGFSQGGATATRWAVQGKATWDSLILWASMMPEDLNWPIDTARLNELQILLAVGDTDEFVSDDRLQKELGFLNEKGIEFDQFYFKGNHDIPEVALKEFIKQRL